MSVAVAAVALWTALGLCATGALLCLLVPHRRLSIPVFVITTMAVGVLLIVSGAALLAGTSPPESGVASPLPFGPLIVQPDRLGGFFLVIIGLATAPIGLYSWGYLGGAPAFRYLRAFTVLWFVLVAALILIVTAADAVLLLMAWEVMAYLSYLLVTFEHDDADVAHAAFLMLAVSEIGTFGIVAAFLLLAQAGGSFDFVDLRAGAAQLSPGARDLVFVLALGGFGAKAGILPLQLWLPEAHPAAPSNLSALLSAVIIKLGIYGIIRVTFDLLGVGPGWWGLLLLLVGAITAVVGILFATVECDLKRVLAYSSIENIGLICVGLGAALAFRSAALPTYAAIVAIAALYHVLNHATYKTLLFLGAGAVHRSTGTRDLGQLGGLVRLMPWTTLCFLVGALAIAAVPPFNGYVSEWMLLESLLRTSVLPAVSARMVVVAGAAAIALTAGIAVTAFVRAVGIGFLGLPRTRAAAHATEVGRSMRAAMAFLAVACLLLGALPTFILPVLNQVTTPLFGISVANAIVPPLFSGKAGAYQALVGLGGTLFRGLPVNGLVLIASPKFNTITAPSYLVLAELLLLALLLLALRAIRPQGRRRRGPVWAGGIPTFRANMQYTPQAYANPIRLIFQGIFRSRVQYEPRELAAHYQVGRIVYQQTVPPPLEPELYRP
ncbi:MAG: hypothetical protein M1118_04765, partial [Chloroflexi bacterium]|nr:hypothetical protein [Chloroflexota bacterium]